MYCRNVSFSSLLFLIAPFLQLTSQVAISSPPSSSLLTASVSANPIVANKAVAAAAAGTAVNGVPSPPVSTRTDVTTWAAQDTVATPGPVATILDQTPPSAGEIVICNGSRFLCQKSYGNVTFMAAANSSSGMGFHPFDGQFLSVGAILNGGVRALHVEIYPPASGSSGNGTGQLRTCVGDCVYRDTGFFLTYMATIVNWMLLETNKNEVVTLFLVDKFDVDISLISSALDQAGASKLSWRPTTPGRPSRAAMPILYDMIVTLNQRLVVFLDTKPSYQDGVVDNTPCILSKRDYFIETQEVVTSVTEFATCALPGPTISNSQMTIAYHILTVTLSTTVQSSFVNNWNSKVLSEEQIISSKATSINAYPYCTIFDRWNAATTNCETDPTQGLLLHANACADQSSRLSTIQAPLYPNIIMVNWVEKGAVLETQDKLNGIPPRSCNWSKATGTLDETQVDCVASAVKAIVLPSAL